MMFKAMTRPAMTLAGFGLLGALLLAFAYQQTHIQIAHQERNATLRGLYALVPKGMIDNDLLADTILLAPDELLKTRTPTLVYRARRLGKPVTTVFDITTHDGYSGDIRMLIGIAAMARISGVRIVSHKETPGLGDDIHQQRSDWILAFSGKSLDDPQLEFWKVKRDGGEFDQFTGATISPRAVVDVVRRTLEYYQAHQEELTAPLAASESQTDTTTGDDSE